MRYTGYNAISYVITNMKYFNNYSDIIEKALELRKEKKNNKEIADILNLKYHQVSYLFNKKYKTPRYFWLSDLEKQFIRDNRHLGIVVIAKALNRHTRTIANYYAKPHFSEQEKQFIKDNLDKTSYRLSKIMNRSYNQINKIRNSF